MAAKFDIEEGRAITKFFDAISDKALARATRNTLNKTAVSVRSQISVKVRENINIKASDIKASISIQRAKGSKPSKMKASVTITDVPIPLEKFGAKPKTIKVSRRSSVTNRKVKRPYRTGVTVKVSKKGPRKLVRGGFLASMRYSEGVFRRKNSTSRKAEKLYGPSVRQMFNDNSFLRKMQEFAAERYEKEFSGSYEAFLRKEFEKLRR